MWKKPEALMTIRNKPKTIRAIPRVEGGKFER
jgi:hypothetical protein